MHSPQSLREDAGAASRMQAALAHHDAGRLADAEHLCRQILAEQPRHADALHMLGLIADRAGQPAAAIDLIRRAISVDAGRTSYHGDLARILADTGRDEEAVAAYRRAVATDPESAGAWCGLGEAYRATGRLDRAIEAWHRALEIRPQSAPVLTRLGAALTALGRCEEGIEALDRALALDPASAEAHLRHAGALNAAGRPLEAMAAFRRATSIDAGLAAAHAGLAAAALEAGHTRVALESADAGLAAQPGFRPALAIKALALQSLGEHDAAAGLLDVDALLRERTWSEVPHYRSAAELNAALAQHVEAHPTLAAEPGAGRRTRELLVEPKGPMAALEEMMRNAIDDYLRAVPVSDALVAHVPPHWRLSARAVLLDAAGNGVPAACPGAWLSGAYFVRVAPAAGGSESRGVRIGLEGATTGAGNTRAFGTKKLQPREALMLLYPSCFRHHLAGAESGRMLVIGFDVVPVRASALPAAAGDTGALLELAEKWLASRALERAEETARNVLELEPGNARALHVLARAAFEKGYVPLAADYLRRAIHAAPDTAQYHIDIATCLRVLQRHDEAVAEMERGFALGADYALAWQTMGGIMADIGRQPESEAAFRTAIARKPALGSAWYGLAQVKRFGAGDPDFAAMLETLSRDDVAPPDRANLHTALGRAYEDIGEYDTAFDHFRSGNDIKHALKPFDAAVERENAQRIVASFTEAVFEAAGGRGSPSELPVFVVGMPRSGTTLVEQILDSHPRVFGAGEINHLWRTVTQIGMYLPRGTHLPEAIGAVRSEAWPFLAETYLDGLRLQAPWAERIVDKLPFNYTLLGVVRLMLPRARIIHCVRDALDTCVSCYTTSFANDRGFTNTLEDLGSTWRAYRQVMDHWEAVLPGGLLSVRYEDLVADTEAVARRLIDHVGLGWSEACLEFHRNPRAVVTASHAQVRQPAYRTSVGRWRRYERHLRPLREALGDTLDRERPR